MPIEIQPDTVIDLQSQPVGPITIRGSGVTLRIGKNAIVNAFITVEKGVSNALIEIGDNCILNGGIRLLHGDGGRVLIGEGTTFNGVGLSQHEAADIIVGRNCMLSTEIHVDVSDMHPMFDRATGERINPPKSVTIGDGVWIGTRVLVLKGATVGDGAIVGAGSLLAGHVPPHCLAVGSPAKVVRENVTWRRDFNQVVTPEGPPPLQKKRRGWLGFRPPWSAS